MVGRAWNGRLRHDEPPATGARATATSRQTARSAGRGSARPIGLHGPSGDRCATRVTLRGTDALSPGLDRLELHPYVRRARGEEPVADLPDPLKSILAATHGTLMFQEQILR
ncbi:hypothetical protein, partial [Deinococcus soli (ex Cha et al. 2016)]|uniref:hypothetical protein n=1 Tax=Deinococcus soli (ex Cha et al. 2016) TaxID=1309411 RepID=UPI0039AF90CF